MDYRCTYCGGTDCKLWRHAHMAGDELICWVCLEGRGHSINLADGDQVYKPDLDDGSWLPAVPTLHGEWWGYTSVPPWWCSWWNALPDKPTQCTLCCGSGKLEEIKCPKCQGTGLRGAFRSGNDSCAGCWYAEGGVCYLPMADKDDTGRSTKKADKRCSNYARGGPSLVKCSLCGEWRDSKTAHIHQYEWIGDECCWDERLRASGRIQDMARRTGDA